MDAYEVGEVIGRGNFGVVHLCRSRESGRTWVMKKISLAEMGHEERVAAAKEVRLLKGLRHVCIVGYRESFVHGDDLVVVMQHCDGGDLRDRIRMQAELGVPFSEAQVLGWFIQVALALDHCHRRRVIHRDIKSQNVFLMRNNVQVKLGDFGIARVLNGTSELAMSVVGTPYSMSPEICENKPYSFASDVWSLGCLLYELCTLRHAFDANNLLGLVWKIVQEEYPPIPDVYSDDLRGLLSAMLAKDPACRPAVKDIIRMPFVQDHLQALAEEQSKIIRRSSSRRLNAAASSSGDIREGGERAAAPDLCAGAADTVVRGAPPPSLASTAGTGGSPLPSSSSFEVASWHPSSPPPLPQQQQQRQAHPSYSQQYYQQQQQQQQQQPQPPMQYQHRQQSQHPAYYQTPKSQPQQQVNYFQRRPQSGMAAQRPVARALPERPASAAAPSALPPHMFADATQQQQPQQQMSPRDMMIMRQRQRRDEEISREHAMLAEARNAADASRREAIMRQQKEFHGGGGVLGVRSPGGGGGGGGHEEYRAGGGSSPRTPTYKQQQQHMLQLQQRAIFGGHHQRPTSGGSSRSGTSSIPGTPPSRPLTPASARGRPGSSRHRAVASYPLPSEPTYLQQPPPAGRAGHRRQLHSDDTPCSPASAISAVGSGGGGGGGGGGGDTCEASDDGGNDSYDDDFELYDSDDDQNLLNEFETARRPPSQQHERGQPPPAARFPAARFDDTRNAAPTMSQKAQAMRSRALRHLTEEEFAHAYDFFSQPGDHSNAREELERILGGQRSSGALLLVEQLVFMERGML